MDKQKALESALAQIERNFGKGSIMKLGQREAAMDIEAISTGSLGLDIALGIGGLPKGRIIEIYGPESSGKTTLALHVLAEQQKKGGICAFVDAEHALDPSYARKLGVDVDELLISQPDAGEQALEIVDTLVRSGAVSVVVVDSVAGRRHGRQLARRSCPADEPGDAQADRFDQPLEMHGDLHQSDPHEDRRDVWLAGNHDRRQRAEVLLLGSARHPPHRRDQGSRRSGR
jgi:RecA/RadA recombinase